jgi:NADH-quinone oxidoreductase subunit M
MQTAMLFILGWPLMVAVGLYVFRRSERTVRVMALMAVGLELAAVLAMTLPLLAFPGVSVGFSASWIPAVGARFDLGWDGLTALMCMMTAGVALIVVLVSPRWAGKKSAGLYSATLAMVAALMGVFLARDGLLFYVFWELALVPAYVMVLGWGGENKSGVALRFFVYMMAGSLLMLLSLMTLYFLSPAPHTFNLAAFGNAQLPVSVQHWIFWGFLLAFLIKTPLVPFHTWQPNTYRTASFPTTMLLAGLLSKMGLYGFYRLLLPVTPDAAAIWAPWIVILGVLGAVYAASVALVQTDIRRLAAYSSVSHLSLVVAGLFSLTALGLQGGVIQILSHAINSVGLFLVLGLLAAWSGTETLSDLGGWAKANRWFTAGFLVVVLGSIAVPLTNGFVGEFLILMGVMNRSLLLAGVAGLTVVLGAWYMLRLYHTAMLGPGKPVHAVTWAGAEKLALGLICVLIFVVGIFPGPILHLSAPVVAQIVVGL